MRRCDAAQPDRVAAPHRATALHADRDKEKSAACASVDQMLAEARRLLASGRLLRSYDVLDGAVAACPQRVYQIAPLLLPIATALSRPRQGCSQFRLGCTVTAYKGILRQLTRVSVAGW
jgi:hypothetical protein